VQGRPLTGIELDHEKAQIARLLLRHVGTKRDSAEPGA
jgi:predicted O-methyltransferase YrrM